MLPIVFSKMEKMTVSFFCRKMRRRERVFRCSSLSQPGPGGRAKSRLAIALVPDKHGKAICPVMHLDRLHAGGRPHLRAGGGSGVAGETNLGGGSSCRDKPPLTRNQNLRPVEEEQ